MDRTRNKKMVEQKPITMVNKKEEEEEEEGEQEEEEEEEVCLLVSIGLYGFQDIYLSRKQWLT